MPRLSRPLDKEAAASADEELYARHADDPRPNPLYDADGNRLPLDPDDPSQDGLRQEWAELYEAAAAAKEPKQPPAQKSALPTSSQPVSSSTENCPPKHWIEVEYIRLPDLKTRPAWWPKEDDGKPYAAERFSAEITDGHKKGTLDDDGSVRYDPIPEGKCSIELTHFYHGLPPVVARFISATAGGKQTHIDTWPKLEVTTVTFRTFKVVNDGEVEFDKEFDGAWKQGRQDPAAKLATASCQSPLCFSCDQTVQLTATFKVTQKPSATAKVTIRGTTSVGGTAIEWRQDISADPQADTVSMPLTAGDKAIPAHVACYDPMEIKWSMTEQDGKTWTDIGSTRNLVYVTLRDPVEVCYWTLLDISCRAADGKETEDEFVPAAFQPFTTHTGDQKGFRRKGDNVDLSYYKYGVATSGQQKEPSPYTARGILRRDDGTGRCGGWASLLIHLFKIHGVTSAGQLWLIRSKDKNHLDGSKRFLVKKCSFAGAGSKPPPYTHIGNKECLKQAGAPGQGKTNPQFDFADHVVVLHGGKIYDPSYGIGPIGSQLEYEQAGLDGLGSMAGSPDAFVFFQSDGTKQFISAVCSPGFLEYQVSGGEKFADIASKYGMTADELFNSPLNHDLKSKRGTADQVVDGDVLLIPRNAKVQMLDGHNV